jgi:hypothetical protein
MMAQTRYSQSASARLRLRVFLFGVPLLMLVAVLHPGQAFASIPNSIYRIDIRPQKDYTRLSVRLADPPQYTLTSIPGNRLRLVIQDAGGTLFKKFRSYSDKNIGGLVLKKRGDDLLVTFQVSQVAGWRDISRPGISAITVDVGAAFKPGSPQHFLGGRERIWNGVEKLVRDFDPPLKSEIPFAQTDNQILKSFLAENEQNDFKAAEAALYKGQLSEAE